MKHIIEYIHTIPGITALQVNTLTSMIAEQIKLAGKKGKK